MKLRLEAGISQSELAELIGEPQQNVAYWEQSDKPPRSDALPKIARVLNVRLEDILDVEGGIPKRSGPAGKLQLVFEEVAKLPRRQQDKVVEFISGFVLQYKQNKTG